MNEKRGHLYLLTGVVIGLFLGLFFSVVLLPTKLVDVSPDGLSKENKAEYRNLIALAYKADGDIGRAKARLSLLKDDDIVDVLSIQAQQLVASEGSIEISSALALLAEALKQESNQDIQTQQPDVTSTPAESSMLPSITLKPGEVIRTATQEPSSTPTFLVSFTPRPTNTSLVSLTLSYALEGQEKICDVNLPVGLLQVQVDDKEGNPVPGARISIISSDGEENFYTGLYPQIGLGYADYLMSVDMEYRLRVGEGGEIVENLTIPSCKKTEGGYFNGGWKLRFTPI